MILDKKLEFADAVSCNTGAAGTYNVGDVLDLTLARDIGNGQPLYLVVSVDTGITTAGSAGTVAFQLVSDGTDTISTTTQSVHAVSKAWTTGSSAIAAGTVLFAIALPMEGTVYERYLAVQQVTGTTALNAGKINAFLTHDVAKWVAYDSPSQA